MKSFAGSSSGGIDVLPARNYKKEKVAKYSALNDRLKFQFVVVETSGGFGPSSMMFHEYVGSNITEKAVTEEKQSTCFSVFSWLLCGATLIQ